MHPGRAVGPRPRESAVEAVLLRAAAAAEEPSGPARARAVEAALLRAVTNDGRVELARSRAAEAALLRARAPDAPGRAARVRANQAARLRQAGADAAAVAAQSRYCPPSAAFPHAQVEGEVEHELRVDVRPAWSFRLRGGTPDGLFRKRGDGVQRLVHVGGLPVHVGAVQPSPERVVFGARAATREAAAEGIARLRFALGVDDDLREFHETFRDDEFIGRVVRERPHLRVRRRTDPWEAFMWAVTEQLIAYEDAVLIQRRIVRSLGARCPRTGLRDAPGAAVVAAQSPALLQSFALTETRAIALRRAAREVAAGRVDLRDPDHEAGWRRLLAIPGIGPWTVEMLAVMGQGRYDQVPAGDLGYIKIVGRISTGRPKARAEIPEVRRFFERYGRWKGLAAEYLRAAVPV